MSLLHNRIIDKANEQGGKISREEIKEMVFHGTEDKSKAASGIIKRMIKANKLERYRKDLFRVPNKS